MPSLAHRVWSIAEIIQVTGGESPMKTASLSGPREDTVLMDHGAKAAPVLILSESEGTTFSRRCGRERMYRH